MIRIFDFLIAFIGIIILMPLMLVIFFILYFENKSPFFLQERIGKNLKSFTLIKFRTMSKGTENCATHLVDSSRITTLGVFLRRTKLDEIPQLWNVLKGEMSFVGPRPCLPIQKELIKYNSQLADKDFIIAFSKADLMDQELLEEFKGILEKEFKDIQYNIISSVSTFGINELKEELWNKLNQKN